MDDIIISCIVFHLCGIGTAVGLYLIGKLNKMQRAGKWVALLYLALIVVQDIVHIILWGFDIK